MKVIFTEEVKGKGKRNEEKDLPNGYANFLISSKKAVPATDENRAKLKVILEKEAADAAKRREEMLALKKEIETKKLVLKMEFGANGKCYTKATTKLVADEFLAQFAIEIDKKKIELPNDLNSVGMSKISVKLDKDITAVFAVEIVEK